MLACSDDQFAQRMIDAQARIVDNAEMGTKEVREGGLDIDMQENCDELQRRGEGKEEEEGEEEGENEGEEWRDWALFVDNDSQIVDDNETHIEDIHDDNRHYLY